ETNEICLKIKNKPYDEFISEAMTAGIIIMEGAEKWDINNRMLVGSQPHGYIAEHYNDMVDKLQGKKVEEYAGSDNAPGGADRIVNGQEIQTKYCATAGKSVGAIYRGENNSYGYFDKNGKPMPVEVPKDQYEQALQITRDKIKAGKIPGITDESEAKNLVIKGHCTRDQAIAMTKFGTFDSLKFDVMDGSVIALKAGGISFVISATMAYLNTKNPKESLRIAVISGGKTALKTLFIYVGAQQVHRIGAVKTLLNNVDITVLPKNMAAFISKGYGAKSISAANKMLQGTIVSSIVVIAVTTGPDLLKMVRGRISQAQFIKNVAVASSGVVGGVAGSLVGGALLAPFGPVGLFIGKTAGGMVGGMVAAQLANKVAGKFMKDDKDVMMLIVRAQIEYLARLFMLTSDEVANLNDNLSKVITSENLERMFAHEDRRAFSNFLIQPLVITIVKQRPVFVYDEKDVIDACAEIAA
ncbi:MAG: hypothetical protein LBD13_00505, partial [Spirochaetaceae bacterium]|nr:hypothetical protein [Spirochaetaceae bacterium]